MLIDPRKNNFPKISIITPSYNQGKFLEKTIQSVLNQKYPNLEYIIIDGGSTDNSVDIIKKYEKFIAYWISEKDNGQTHAINKGLKKVKGDIVAYINSDDVYMENTFHKVAVFFQNHPEYSLIYGNCYIIDENGKILSKKIELDFDYLMGCFIGFGIIIPQPTVFFTREVLIKVGYFNEEFNYSMDAEYWERVALVLRIAHVPEFLAGFRTHKTSKTNIHKKSATEEYFNESLQLLKRSYENIWVSKIIPYKYSFFIRKIYHMKRILLKLLHGYYFG